ncbi:MAG: YbhB/YbcL family Raf kinase inhibitor-like protein [Bdellovibrionales bacterium]|nr:YbhB/YbcL family Raf kinase inhibitor-like protein [Bdellovibrionales bacterium]
MNEFTLRTTSFDINQTLPNRFVYNGSNCQGENISPELEWDNPPEGTKSFAITVFDPDAPEEGWWHWTVVNIPAYVSKIPEGASNEKHLPQGAVEGETDFGQKGYGGACPPPGKPHRYIFTVYALKKAKVKSDFDSIDSNALAKASFTVKYGR